MNDDKEPITPEYGPDNKSRIELTNEAYSRHDYFRCGTLLRIQCEQCLKELLPSSYRSKEDPQTRLTIEKNLDEQINSLEDFCKHERIDFTPFKQLKSYKDLFLNSLDLFLYPSEIFIKKFEHLKDVLGIDYVDKLGEDSSLIEIMYE